ncbi:bifunctional diguanylate cyclase/phosphodiesterase [Deinococcus sp. QL22]|uniref:putative bifunctional diguanylate cyclase/phosphodiesterase n=1 Tax=Deinococcus sp. QL22 TaxID=2939437 RepID=UPI002016BF51|nr:EAL domain-containing protein [Deinococcus sp. QL22]UQN09060.1 EAL domain-containing protein [Deinococcus sp. QL22]
MVTPPLPLRIRFPLRLKVLAALALAGMGLMFVVAALLPRLVLARFDEQEKARMRQNTQRAAQALQSEQKNLSTFVLNWSVWDDTYRYVQRPTRDYEKNNLVPSSFEAAAVNLFVYFTPQGQLVSAWFYDLNRQRFEPATSLATEIKRVSPSLLTFRNLEDVQEGLVTLSGKPWLLAARPIVTSAGKGPAAGTIVMGKALTPLLLDTLKRDSQLTLQVQVTSEARARVTLEPGEIFVQPLNQQRIEGQLQLLDFQQRASLILKVSSARVDHANGLITARVILLAVLGMVLLFTALIMMLVEALILRRLAVYRQKVQVLQASKGRAGRLPVSGQDELSALGDALNSLLDRTDQHQQQLVDQASRDELTGLPNRRRFSDQLSGVLEGTTAVAVALIDLNGFKSINDTLGHEIGDEILRDVANRFATALATSAPGMVARLGGDEFVLLLEVQTMEAALERTQQLLNTLNCPLSTSAGDLFVSASAGVSHSPLGGNAGDVSILLRHADLAMYHAKITGQAVEAYTPHLSDEAQRRAAIERELRGALDREEFALVYQPLVNLHSGRIVGCEALLRWQRRGHGPVSPAQFIPVAEETGLIMEIGRWVLNTACTQAMQWHAAGLSLKVAVNISAVQLRDGTFVAQLAEVLRDSGLPSGLLEIEVTETAVIADLAAATRQLAQVRALGVTVSLDDFGTGYASLELVRELPLDKLKLDRSFMRGADTDPRRQVILASVIRMAGELGLQVVAEGVETPQQAALLQTWHCPLAQGFLYAKPLTPAALWEFAQQSHSTLRMQP